MNKILFSGASNTLGIGLELEFMPKYNNHEWLLENGITMPDVINLRSPEIEKIWKKYRWSSLVCKELGYEEFNIMDSGGHTIKYPGLPGDAFETIWMLNEEKELLNLLDDVKYVILEMGNIRWWDKELHGKNEKKYPNTIIEILNFIKNSETSAEDRIKAINWIKEVDSKVYIREAMKKFLKLQSKYKDIKFLWLPWLECNYRDKENKLGNSMIDMEFKASFPNPHIQTYLSRELKMTIGQTAKCFNGDYKYNRKDEHANAEGHKWVASKVIKHIKKLEGKL
jgi:hypothetical protein